MANPTGRPRKGTSPSKLTPNQMQALHKAGKPINTIARAADVTPQTVRFHLSKTTTHQYITPGLAIYIYRQYKSHGRTVKSIAAETNVSITRVRLIIRTRGNRPD